MAGASGTPNILPIARIVEGAGFNTATDSLRAISLAIAAIGGGGLGNGMAYAGVVTGVPGANQFTIATLDGATTGLGNTAFVNWSAYVMWDAGGAGAAPQGEQQLVTVYTSAAGTFTTAAFTAPVGLGDIIIIIHPNLATLLSNLTVPAADSVNNVYERDVIGNKADTASTTVNATTSLMRYLKGLLGLHPVPGADAVANTNLRDVVGDKSDTATYSASATASLMRYIKAMLGTTVIATGTLTTDDYALPRDNGRAEANDYWKGCLLMTTAGAVAFQPRTIVAWTQAGGIFNLGDFSWTANPGLVPYVILAAQEPLVAGSGTNSNFTFVEVVGNKSDSAVYASATTKGLVGYLKGLINSGIAIKGAVSDAGPAITDFDTNLTEATNNHYNGMLLMFIDGPNAGQAHHVSVYTGATKNCAFATGDQWTDIPVNGNSFVIVPDSISYLAALIGQPLITTGTLTTSSTTVPADVGRTEANNYWDDCLLIPTAGAVALEPRRIKSFANAGGVFTLDKPFTAVPGLVTYVIVPNQVSASVGRQLFTMDFWSATQALVSLTDAAAPGTNVALPDVVVAGLPTGATITRATAFFKFRILENSAGGANKLQGAQDIQVQKGGGGGYSTGIAMVDDLFGIAAGPLREGGDVLMGNTDLAAKVTANDTYNFQWTAALVDAANLNFYDVQTGLRILYSV